MAFWRSRKPADETTDAPSGAPTEGASPGATDPTPSSEPAPSGDSVSSGDQAPGGPASENLFAKMRSGLQKTRRVLNTDVRDLFRAEGRLVDEELLEELFARLIRTDMGAGPAATIRDDVAKKYRGRVVQLEDVLETISEQIATMLAQESADLRFAQKPPTVILVVGVNGSGKTTSIGKLADHLQKTGRRVVLGAGDTFRAAAVEQLTIWAERIGCDIITGKSGADPASVAYQTVEKALETGADVAIIDTAGRLQTQGNLMQQLEKIHRVVGKKVEDAPHEVLLVLDATAGQNAISQAQGFSEAAHCTGIVLAKLDGTARGGVILPIRQQFELPVKFIGVGEGLGDLAKFDAKSFARALFEG